MEAVFKICALALICTALAAVIRHGKPDMAFAVRTVGYIAMVTAIISAASPIISYIRELMDGGGMGEYAEFLFRALGIGLLTYICGAICRECGENTMGDLIDVSGRIAITVMSIPLIRSLMDSVLSLTDLRV